MSKDGRRKRSDGAVAGRAFLVAAATAVVLVSSCASDSPVDDGDFPPTASGSSQAFTIARSTHSRTRRVWIQTWERPTRRSHLSMTP